jgi:thioredoxin 1
VDTARASENKAKIQSVCANSSESRSPIPNLRAFVTACCIIKPKIEKEYKMAEVIITKSNFENEVLKSDKPVLIDFWATWCGPCRMLAPVIEEIANERSDIKVGKVNVDDEGELATAFGISSIPTVVLMKDGKVVSQSVGYRPKEQLLEMLK